MTWQLLSRIVQHHALSEIAARRITSEMFADPSQRKVYEFITRHYGKYQKIPSQGLLGRKFPHAQVNLTVEEPTAFYADQFLAQHLRAHGAAMLLRHAESLKDDPLKVLEALSDEARELLGYGTVSQDTRASENWRERLRLYKRIASGEMLGIPTPFETWNDMAMGWQPEDYIIITARPGVGKTFMLLYLAAHARKLKHKILVLTKEMSIRTVQLREDAMLYGLPYKQLRRGQLTEGQYKQYVKGMKHTARLVREGEFGESIYIHDANSTIAGIANKIEEYEPAVVFIDGLYLVRDLGKNASKAQHEQMANISRATRAMAQQFKIPIIATSQIHRMPGNLEKHANNLTLGDLAFSDAMAQDPETVLALIKRDEDRAAHRLFIKTLKMREGETKDFYVNWDLNDPTQIKEIDGDMDEDDDAEDDDNQPLDDDET